MTRETPVQGDDLDGLIARCLDGDQDAWQTIVERHRRRVFNVAYQFVGRHDEAEDLTQDVFLKLFRSLETFDRRANFLTWLTSVSRNLCIDHYRSVRKERESMNRSIDPATLSPVATTPSPQVTLERRDRARQLREALDALPESLRTAVMLRDIQELTYQDIAARLDVPDGTVKSRINRGRAELARELRRRRNEASAAAQSKGAT